MIPAVLACSDGNEFVVDDQIKPGRRARIHRADFGLVAFAPFRILEKVLQNPAAIRGPFIRGNDVVLVREFGDLEINERRERRALELLFLLATPETARSSAFIGRDVDERPWRMLREQILRERDARDSGKHRAARNGSHHVVSCLQNASEEEQATISIEKVAFAASAYATPLWTLERATISVSSRSYLHPDHIR